MSALRMSLESVTKVMHGRFEKYCSLELVRGQRKVAGVAKIPDFLRK